MSAAKHTPGPFYVSKANPLRVIESGPRGLTLATFSARGRGVTAADAVSEAEANAVLFAASPEMLDVLQTIVRQCGARLAAASCNTALLDHAQRVIAKATGGAS